MSDLALFVLKQWVCGDIDNFCYSIPTNLLIFAQNRAILDWIFHMRKNYSEIPVDFVKVRV